jgi:hypothetical protein
MARSPQITVYPGDELKQIVQELADADGRSDGGLVLLWIRERPEVQERLNGDGDGA